MVTKGTVLGEAVIEGGEVSWLKNLEILAQIVTSPRGKYFKSKGQEPRRDAIYTFWNLCFGN